MKVAVLGCGPAGLIAAHTAERLGHNVHVFSRLVKSNPSGAQVLHQPVKGLEIKPFYVEYHKFGSRGGYAEKVYGNPEAPCSWDLYPAGVMNAWPMRETYDELWLRFGYRVRDLDLDNAQVQMLAMQYDKVFSTVPLPQIMPRMEWDIFSQQPVWISQGKVDRPNKAEFIHYVGTPRPDWYRHSLIRSYASWEFSHEPVPGWPFDYVKIQKPLDVVGGDDTRRDLVPENVVLVGRYGEWRKGRLAHHAQEVVEEELGAE